MTTLAVLRRGAADLGLDVSAEQLDLFERYADLLLSSGRRAGVTAIATGSAIEQRHFVESLALAKALLDAGVLRESAESRVLDVGSGGGIPGLPIKILLPQLRLTLLDARERTAAFLDEAVQLARYRRRRNRYVARAEDAGRDPAYRERFDVVAGAGGGAAAGPAGADAALPAGRRAPCRAQGKRRCPGATGGRPRARGPGRDRRLAAMRWQFRAPSTRNG